jgi:DNA polymerase elongation subunit (family B)/intein/homing endonuclease
MEKLLLIDANYAVLNDKTVIELYCLNEKGKVVVLLDDTFEPYFYVLPKQGKENEVKNKIENLRRKEIKRVEIVERKLLGENKKFLKVFCDLPQNVQKMRDIIKEWENEGIVIEEYEYSISFYKRYLIDKQISGMQWIEVEGEEVDKKEYQAEKVLKLKKLKVLEDFELPKIKILAFDIETVEEGGKLKVIMISLFGENFKKVLTYQADNYPEYVEVVENEKKLLERFVEIIKKEDPDFLIGYNSDMFDFQIFQERADELKVKLFLSRDGSYLKFAKRARISAAKLNGRIHIDIFNFVNNILSPALQTETLTLDSVSAELLGDEKIEMEFEEILKAWRKRKDLAKLAEYCLKDAELTLRLGNLLLPQIFEICKVVGQLPFDVSRMTYGQLVEWYLTKKAFINEEIILNQPKWEDIQKRKLVTYTGAFVKEPIPGIHEKIAVLDFRSLYPSIITSFNVSLETLNCDCCKNDGYKVPELNYYFCKRKKGFVASAIKELIEKRIEIKEKMKKINKDSREWNQLYNQQYALKIIANASYGMFAFPGAKWYSKECAESCTAFGRYYIKEAMDFAKKEGFTVIYGDSLSFNRKIFISTPEGDIKLVKIGEFVDKNFGNPNSNKFSTLALENGSLKFQPIVRLIRHEYKGKMLEFFTQHGRTVVTPQHSIYAWKDGKITLCDASKLKVGDYLLSLTSPSIKVKYKEGYVFDLVKLSWGEYKDKLRLWKDDLKFPKGLKGKCPYCGGKFLLYSHVSGKHSDRKKLLTTACNWKWIGGKTANTTRIPRFWKLTKELAWVLGFYCAEGSVTLDKKCFLSFANQKRTYIEKVKRFFDTILKENTNIIKYIDKRTGKPIYYYRLNGLPLSLLFSEAFDCGRKSSGKRVPFFLFNAEEKIKRAFLSGYLAGDGNKNIDKRYKTKFIEFSTKSVDLAMGIQFLLKSYRFTKNKFGKFLRHVYWKYRKDKPGIFNLRLQSAKKEIGNICLTRINKIKEINYNHPYVYDIEVSGAHNFVDAEGLLLVHNTDSMFLKLEKGDVEVEIKKFLNEINKKLPGMMELELQDIYKCGIFIPRGIGPGTAKKKYALIDFKGNLLVRGLEKVRRDWCKLARDTQEKVLRLILEKNDMKGAVGYVKEVIKNLREHKVNLKDLTIYEQLVKPIEEYKAVGPHVMVAKKMRERGKLVGPGIVIMFAITKGKGSISERAEPIEDVKLEDIDEEYYIHHQILPAALRILTVLGVTEEELLGKVRGLREFI